MKPNTSVVVQALERIDEIAEHCRRVEDAMRFASKLRPYGPSVGDELLQALNSLELAAWRGLLAHGLGLSDQERSALSAAVVARFPSASSEDSFVEMFNRSFLTNITAKEGDDA